MTTISNDDANGQRLVPEEEVLDGDWMRPQVSIKEVEVVTGEEDEEIFWKHRAKLYRWAKESSIWKERGLGEAKLLRHKETKKIRFLLRQEKTLKIVANHYVLRLGTFCELKPNVSSDRIWVWSVTDFSEDEPNVEQFGLKFGQPEPAAEFKAKFEEATELNGQLMKPDIAKAEEAQKAAAQKSDEQKSDEQKRHEEKGDEHKSDLQKLKKPEEQPEEKKEETK